MKLNLNKNISQNWFKVNSLLTIQMSCSSISWLASPVDNVFVLTMCSTCTRSSITHVASFTCATITAVCVDYYLLLKNDNEDWEIYNNFAMAADSWNKYNSFFSHHKSLTRNQWWHPNVELSGDVLFWSNPRMKSYLMI